MCGIVGQISFASPVDRDALTRQRDSMVHRGPDSAGIWIAPDARVGFGHRRLAIVDLTPGGHQPMIHPPTGNCICFNGEIYNFQKVRSTLEDSGVQFQSQSDTEVILAAYATWGVDCLDRLDGMFAFALYDASAQRVVLARDRAGEKPLYIWRGREGLAFSSEVKALLEDPRVDRRASPASISEYLTYGYVSGSATMFRDVSRLPAAHVAVVDLNQATVETHRYWELPRPNSATSGDSSAALAAALETRLTSSVAAQLVADVPVGVLLSGGVDSSVIAAIAARASSTRIRTFTARFPDLPAADEGPYARLVADHIGSEHTELETAPADEALLHALAAQFDDPIADSSLIPTYLLAREIRKHATVALGGDGGDELFGGYRHYPAQIARAKLRDRFPRPVGQLISSIAGTLLPESTPGIGHLSALGSSDGEIVAAGSRLFRPKARREVLGRQADADFGAAERNKARVALDVHGILATSTATDFRSYMVDDVLVKVDRASMLTSLEVRAPFLSRDVIEFAFADVPSTSKVFGSDRKIVLRTLGERLLPPSLDLRRKQGFDIPLDVWIKGAWRPLLQELAGRKSSLLHVNPLRDLLPKVGTRPVIGEQVFAIMMLLLWEAQYRITW